MPLQSHLSSLTLARLLQEWAPVSGDPPRQDVAQRLGDWLSAFDSVKLDAALQTIASYGASRQATTRPRDHAVDASALDALGRRVKADLTDLITSRSMPSGPQFSASRNEAPGLAPETDYGKYHQRYAELQQQMDTKISACRAQVRQAMSKGTPRLRQLAALDGVMAEMLGEREQKLLSAVPVYLERRFAYWRQVHQHALATSGLAADDDDLQRWQQPGGWLHGFQQDMRQMLLADLQARLQPVLGLIEAVQDETDRDKQQA